MHRYASPQAFISEISASFSLKGVLAAYTFATLGLLGVLLIELGLPERLVLPALALAVVPFQYFVFVLRKRHVAMVALRRAEADEAFRLALRVAIARQRAERADPAALKSTLRFAIANQRTDQLYALSRQLVTPALAGLLSGLIIFTLLSVLFVDKSRVGISVLQGRTNNQPPITMHSSLLRRVSTEGAPAKSFLSDVTISNDGATDGRDVELMVKAPAGCSIGSVQFETEPPGKAPLMHIQVSKAEGSQGETYLLRVGLIEKGSMLVAHYTTTCGEKDPTDLRLLVQALRPSASD